MTADARADHAQRIAEIAQRAHSLRCQPYQCSLAPSLCMACQAADDLCYLLSALHAAEQELDALRAKEHETLVLACEFITAEQWLFMKVETRNRLRAALLAPRQS